MGGQSGTEGGCTRVTYFVEEGVLFKTSACPQFVKEGYFFVPRYIVWGVENPHTIHKISAALTLSDSEVTGLPSLLLKLKYVLPFIECQCFDKRSSAFLLEKVGVF